MQTQKCHSDNYKFINYQAKQTSQNKLVLRQGNNTDRTS